MKYLNIATKKIIYFLRIYFLLITLLLICATRVYFYKIPEAKILNYKTSVLITNPYIIENGIVVLHTSSFIVKTRQFNNYKLGYSYYVTGDKYYNNIYANNIKEEGKSPLFPLFLLKGHLINSLERVLMEPFYSLVLGMLYGVPPNYSEDFTNILIKTGVIHIIVVSGYNISVLFSFVSKVFFYISLKKRMFLASLISILYAIFTGFEPPIIRALIFGLLIAFAKSIGGKVNILYALIITALIMTIISPSVIYSVSFQLSFMACLGLILFSQDFGNMVNKIKVIKDIPLDFKDALVSSVCAQILVFPILLYYFKGMSLLGVFTNTLVLWTVPYIMLLGFVFSLFSLYLPLIYIVKPFVLILYLPLVYFLDVINFMFKFSFLSLSVSFTTRDVLLSYFILFFIYLTYKKLIKINEKNI